MSPLDQEADDQTGVGLLRLRLADSEKATAALQKMVDALSSLPALEEFVPAVLRIIASAFQTMDCSYCEHRRGEPIRLRYWFRDGHAFGPDEMRGFGDDQRYAGVKALGAGFHVPDSYLGMSFRNRTKALVLEAAEPDPRQS